MRAFVALATSALALLSAHAAHAEPLKLASWNMEFLAERNGTGCFNKGKGRTDADYARLKVYLGRLNADVIALQEVQNEAAVRRVFGAEFDILVSGQADADQTDTCRETPQQRLTPQKTAFAVRNDKGLTIQRHADYVALDVHNDRRLRYGVDVTISRGGAPIRLLSVHLKSGCAAKPPTASDDCKTLFAQLPALEAWIDTRFRDNEPFAVLGYFNRRLTRRGGDVFFKEIDDNDPVGLNLWTAAAPGQESPCDPDFQDFIDHLVFGPRAAQGYLDDRSFGTLVYDEAESPRPSDHCPVYATINLPPSADRVAPAAALRRLERLARIAAQDTLPSRRDLRWLRNSAEYAVVAHQAYHQATRALGDLAADHPSSVPWAVAIDADETIFDNTDAEVAQLPKPDNAPFDGRAWRAWVAQEKAGAIPGARPFLERVVALGGRIVVITNRDSDQDHHTRANLKAIGIDFPSDQLCVLGRSSADRHDGNEQEWRRYGFRNDKDRRRRLVSLGLARSCWLEISDSRQSEIARQSWSKPHQILMYVGDSIADLPGITGDVANSAVLLREIATNPRYVVLPNPTYGSTWEKRTSRAAWE